MCVIIRGLEYESRGWPCSVEAKAVKAATAVLLLHLRASIWYEWINSGQSDRAAVLSGVCSAVELILSNLFTTGRVVFLGVWLFLTRQLSPRGLKVILTLELT